MAIDSAEKRKSAAGVGFWIFGPGVTPNASKDAEWRQQAGWGYSGIAAGAPVVVTVFGDVAFTSRARRKFRSVEREAFLSKVRPGFTARR